MTITFPPCLLCRHFDAENRLTETCAAFPDGIPEIILAGRHNHQTPYPGDHGIQFERIETSSRAWADERSPTAP
jgi:hypothetical protein